MISFKKHLCYGLSIATSIEDLKKNKVIFLTPTGIVQGRIILATEESEKPKWFHELVSGLADGFKEDRKTQEDTPLDSIDNVILLKDVEIIGLNGDRTNAPFFALFIDQIVGVSIGDID